MSVNVVPAPRHRARAGQAAVGGLALVLVVLALDRLLGDRSLLHERPPEWSLIYGIRTALLAAASFLLVAAGRRFADGCAAAGFEEVQPGVVIAGALGAGIGLIAAAMLILAPRRLTSLAVEDGPAEWLSAVLAFLAVPMIGVALSRFRRHESVPVSSPALLTVGAVAIASLLIGLEEVSWFQRLIDYGSPEALEGRNQPEFNLHNAATGLSENVYYFGSFLVLVAVPAILAQRPLPRRWSGWAPVVPGRAVMYGTVAGSALVYEMWEIIPIQISFFAGLALVLTDGARVGTWRLGPAMAATMIITALVFLTLGDEMTRSWDDTEIRELFPVFGLFIYGWELLNRSSRSPNCAGGNADR